MKIKIKKVRDGAELPAYQTVGAAGFDFHAAIDTAVTLKPGQHRAFPTGVSVEIPAGYELQIRPRSGLAYKYGVTMLNGVGTIDSDFRGEMNVMLVNFGDQDFVVEPAMRIAQGVVERYEKVEWVETQELSETERGAGGLGSTGK
ncbi:MAG: dUTP diphosphatase [Candidatus Nomurabacteria bacterium]|jgi:dUTP pyrophosphatase|nr:dUTP diphosphatase [Candidatus Nomurabacteria bacterium]